MINPFFFFFKSYHNCFHWRRIWNGLRSSAWLLYIYILYIYIIKVFLLLLIYLAALGLSWQQAASSVFVEACRVFSVAACKLLLHVGFNSLTRD